MKRVDLGIKLAVFGAAVVMSLGADGGCQSTPVAAPPTTVACVDLPDTRPPTDISSYQLNLTSAESFLSAKNYPSAIPLLTSAATAPQLRGDAYLGLGEAYASSASPSYAKAQACYAGAVSLVANDAAKLAEAHHGNGMALLAMSRSGMSAAANQTPYPTRAIDELSEAVKQPTAARYFDLSDAYLSRNQSGDLAKAVQAFDLGAQSSPGAIDRQAEVGLALSRKLTDPAQKLGVLNRVLTADPNSLEASVEAGKIHYDQHQYQDARNLFQTAVNLADRGTASPSSGQTATIAAADARYFLSVMTTEGVLGSPNNSALESAIRNAEMAGADPRYRRQACLARIMRGGEYVTGAGSSVCEANATPEGQLLRGMLYIRRSQLKYRPAGGFTATQLQAWQSDVGSADSAFRQGQAQLSANSGAAPMWSDDGQTVPVADLLNYGLAIIEARCRPPLGPVSASPDVGWFFQRYRVSNCGG